MDNLDLNKIVSRPVEAAHKKHQEEMEQSQRTNDSNKALVYGFPQLAEMIIVPTFNKISAELKKLGEFTTEISVFPRIYNGSEMPLCSFSFTDERIIPGRTISDSGQVDIGLKRVNRKSDVVKPYYDAWGVGRQHLNSLDEITEEFITKIC